MEDALIHLPPGIVNHAPDTFSEFDCLNLNITMPANANEKSQYPVMMYIHGGGGYSGSNSDWWCDGGALVQESIRIGKPIIMVSINYRLGPLGFIGSLELQEELGLQNTGNFAPRDMHLATIWINKYITPFGGSSSPSKLTIYGESAGAIGVETLIHSLPQQNPKERTFGRAILQSGNLDEPLISVPETLDVKSAHYSATKTALKIEGLKELQEVAWEELWRTYFSVDPRGGMPCTPLVDGVFLGEDWRGRFPPSFSSLEGEENGNGNGDRIGNGDLEIMIGTTARESSIAQIIGVPSPHPSLQTLITSLSTIMPRAQVDKLLTAYKMPTHPGENNEEVIGEKLLDMIEDLGFYKPARDFADRARGRLGKGMVREYAWERGNPFTGAFGGVACHAVELVWLHGGAGVWGGLKKEGGGVEGIGKGKGGREEEEEEMGRLVRGVWVGFAYDGVSAASQESQLNQASNINPQTNNSNTQSPQSQKQIKTKVKIFNTPPKVEEISEEKFYTEKRRREAWRNFDDMDGEVGMKDRVMGVCFGLYLGML